MRQLILPSTAPGRNQIIEEAARCKTAASVDHSPSFTWKQYRTCDPVFHNRPSRRFYV